MEEETEAHMTEMRLITMKMQQAGLHYERTLLRKYGIAYFPFLCIEIHLQINDHLADLYS